MILTKPQWIEKYGGQALLDAEGLEVVPCLTCGDTICYGWRVRRKNTPYSLPREKEALIAALTPDVAQLARWADEVREQDAGLKALRERCWTILRARNESF